MGLFLSFKENYGMHIENTPLGVIDIILRKVGGTKSRREADFEIRGVSNLKKLHISYRDGLVKVVDNIYIGIRDTKTSGKKAEIHYSGDYKFKRIKYD